MDTPTARAANILRAGKTAETRQRRIEKSVAMLQERRT